MTLPEPIAEMEAVAAKATSGPWTVDGPSWNQIVWSSAENRVCFLAHSNGADDERDIATGKLIALASPDNIAAIITAYREMETDRDRTARNRDMWKGQCERQAEQLTAMRTILREALAALEPIGAEADEWADDVPDAYHPGVTEPGHSQAHASAKFSLGDLRRTRTVSSKIKESLPHAE